MHKTTRTQTLIFMRYPSTNDKNLVICRLKVCFVLIYLSLEMISRPHIYTYIATAFTQPQALSYINIHLGLKYVFHISLIIYAYILHKYEKYFDVCNSNKM